MINESRLPEYNRKIERRSLDECEYFMSLMNAAASKDLISPEQEFEIKRGCTELLVFRIKQFTEGQSSSVPTDTARELLAAVYYQLGLGLKKHPEPDAALEALLSEGVNAIYTEGGARQRELLLKARRVYQSLNRDFCSYGCIYYEGAVHRSLPKFFKKYVPDNHRLLAQDTITTFDYPAYLNSRPTTGVEFVKNYVEQLYCENAFCTCFSEDAVKELLTQYDNHYTKVVFNVFELVYCRAIGRLLCGEEPLSLELPDNYHNRLSAIFEGKQRGEVTQLITQALDKLDGFITLSPASQKYARVCVPQTASATVTALRLGALKRVFF